MITSQFIADFPFLSKTKKSLWRILANLSQTYSHVFPSQAWLAEKIDCSRETVNRAIQEFKSYDWIATIQEGKTSTYLLHSEIMQSKECRQIWLDSPKKVTAKIKNVTRRRTGKTPENVTLLKENSLLKDTYNVPTKKELKIKDRPLPYFISTLPIDRQARFSLSQYPEQVLFEAYNDLKFFQSAGKVVLNYNALLISRAKHHSLVAGRAGVETLPAPKNTPAQQELSPRQLIADYVNKEQINLPKEVKIEFFNKYIEFQIGITSYSYDYSSISEIKKQISRLQNRNLRL